MKYNFQFRKMNESETHYALKQIAKYICWNRRYNIIGEEVFCFSTNSLGNKNVADVIGIKMPRIYGKLDKIKIDTICIEARQSKQDYYNGFVSSCDLNYIITQKGLLTPDEILPGVGLIEVDFDKLNLHERRDSKCKILDGVETVINAKRNKNVDFCRIDMLRHVAYRNTAEELFIRHGIGGLK